MCVHFYHSNDFCLSLIYLLLFSLFKIEASSSVPSVPSISDARTNSQAFGETTHHTSMEITAGTTSTDTVQLTNTITEVPFQPQKFDLPKKKYTDRYRSCVSSWFVDYPWLLQRTPCFA